MGEQPGLYSWRNLTLNVVQLAERKSVGAKRTIAVKAARGEIVVHWDVDDLYPPNRVRLQVSPLLRGEAWMTAGYINIFGHLPEMLFIRSQAAVLFLGSLAYSKQLALELNGFADVSYSEDYDFVVRALISCKKLVPVNISSVYMRHGNGGGNTWMMNNEERVWMYGEIPERMEPPEYVTSELKRRLVSAHVDAQARGKCPQVNAFKPDIPKLNTYPNMPDVCANGDRNELDYSATKDGKTYYTSRGPTLRGNRYRIDRLRH